MGHRERSERNTSVQAAKKNRPSEVEARNTRGKTAQCRLEGETARAHTGPGQRLGVAPGSRFGGAGPVSSWEQYSTPHWPPLPKGEQQSGKASHRGRGKWGG